MRYVIASTVLAVMFIGSVVLNLYLAEHVVQASQAQWCSVLELLTTRAVRPPADPGKAPAQERAYVFYTNLRTLEVRFRC